MGRRAPLRGNRGLTGERVVLWPRKKRPARPSQADARLSVDALARRFPKLEAWEQGERHPTLKQLERFAKATFTPVGFLFLEEPPVERVSIPDKFLFRRDKPLQSSPQTSALTLDTL